MSVSRERKDKYGTIHKYEEMDSTYIRYVIGYLIRKSREQSCFLNLSMYFKDKINSLNEELKSRGEPRIHIGYDENGTIMRFEEIGFENCDYVYIKLDQEPMS